MSDSPLITDVASKLPRTRLIDRLLSEIDFLFVHKTDSIHSTPLKTAAFHVNTRKWGRIGYHYMVSQNGAIWQTLEPRYIGAHCQGYNRKSIGIAFVGLCKEPLTDAQVKIFPDIISYLRTQIVEGKTLRLYGHKEYGDTDCPGEFVMQLIRDIRKANVN